MSEEKEKELKSRETLKVKIDNCCRSYFSNLDINVEIHVILSGIGWIKIVIVTNVFKDLSDEDREKILDDALSNIGYSSRQFPILCSDLLTPDEAKDYEYEPLKIPLWSDVLMLPDEVLGKCDFREIKTSPVFTFYSVCYGGNSSKTLILTANILANVYERKVAILDLNFNSPYLSSYILENENSYGALDYIYGRRINPENDFPLIQSCIYPIKSNKGQLSLIPSSKFLDSWYLHRLAEIDRGSLCVFYKKDFNPLRSLIKDIKSYLNPDVILIDTTPGFSDISGIALLDLADIGVPCFTPNNHSFKMMDLLLKVVRKNQSYQQRPELLFVVNPSSQDLSIKEMEIAKDWLKKNWCLSTDKICLLSPDFIPPILDEEIPDEISNKYLAFASRVNTSIDTRQPY